MDWTRVPTVYRIWREILRLPPRQPNFSSRARSHSGLKVHPEAIALTAEQRLWLREAALLQSRIAA